MFVLVPRVLEQAEEDETSRYRRVQHTQEDEGRDHEGECHLLKDGFQGAERRGRHVLVANVGVDDSAHKAEDNDLSDST